MAIAFVQEFTIVDGDTSTTNYDRVAAEIDGTPDGLLIHSAGFDHDRGVFRILDVWESREAGQRFMDDVLMPIIGRMAEAAPEGEFAPPSAEYWYELHDVIS